MTEAFLGEIRLMAFSYAPMGWALCDGRTLPIQQYTALFAVLGNMYGGDGRTTFALPNLQGRVPIAWGNGTSLTPRAIADSGGEQTVTLRDLPTHTHTALGSSGSDLTSPTGATWGTQPGRNPPSTYFNGSPNIPMNNLVLGSSGGSAPHNNMQPYLAMNFFIAVMGYFPVRG
jgi:microcystin-dependent protein